VCGFFTWPASSTGNFLISYATPTEPADYSVEHLKKTIRMRSTTPGLEGSQLIAHSRGTALLLAAVRKLALEAIPAGKEPLDLYKIDNLMLLSPDTDMDIAGQQIPRFLSGYRSDPDLIQMIRYAKPLGGPGRQLNKTGPVTWEFPVEATAKRD
jgi:esterase/lipase superfamily enzyme